MHVHIFKAGSEIVIEIEGLRIRDNWGMTRKNARREPSIW